MSDLLENAMAEWFARAITGAALDETQFAAEHHVSVEELRAALAFAPQILERHRQASADDCEPAHLLGPGSQLGDYEIQTEVGRGAMGIVYRAVQHPLERTVAIKVLAPHLVHDRARRERFLREAQAVAALDHPHIVRVLAAGEQEGVAYLAMEWVPGRTLADLLQRSLAQRLRPVDAARLCEMLARALHHAHERGILHRDVKPANVLIDASGAPRLADFGLAKRLADTVATASGDLMGSPAYASPEQVQGRALGPQADVWALGVLLYECLTGQRPFAGETVESVMRSILVQEPRPLRQMQRAIDRSLEAICMKALTKSCASRYPSAAAFAEDLRAFQRGDPVSARPVTALARWLRRTLRHPWRVTGIAALLLLVLGGTSLMIAYRAVRAHQLAEMRAAVEQALVYGDSRALEHALRVARAEFPDDPQLLIASAERSVAAGDLVAGHVDLRAAASRMADAARAAELESLAEDLDLVLQRSSTAMLAASDIERLLVHDKRVFLDPVVGITRGHLLAQLGHCGAAADALAAGRFADARYTVLVAGPLGDTMLDCGRAREALDLLAQWTTAKSPPQLHYQTVSAAVRAREPERARIALKRMQELHPQSAFTVAAELELRRPDRFGPVSAAIPDLSFVDEALARTERAPDKQNAGMLVQRLAAETLCRGKQFDRAIAMFERLTADPSAPLSDLLGLAFSFLFSGDKERGLSTFRRALERAESRPLQRDLWRGAYLVQAQQHAEAVPHLTRATELMPADVQRWQVLAWAHMKLTEDAATLVERGEHARASATAWARAVALEPTTRLYWESEGTMLIELAAIAKAMREDQESRRYLERAEHSIRVHASAIPDAESHVRRLRTYLEDRVVALRRKYRTRGPATSQPTGSTGR